MRRLLGLSAVLAALAGAAGCGGERPEAPRLDLAALPMRFEPAAGGMSARGRGYALTLTPRGSQLRLRGLDAPLRTRFVGGRGAPRGEGRLAGRTNHLVGDRSQWRTNVPGYARAVQRDVWPGIDVAYRGDGRRLEYDFRVAAGADPRRIVLDYGGSKLRLADDGDLVVDGVLREQAPRSFQDGRKVESRFVVDGDRVRIALGDYDRTRPLLIDPVLSIGTYLGGTGGDFAQSTAVDGDGNIYVAGGTLSAGFPTTGGAFQEDIAGGQDGYVTKFAPDGKTLVYSTFIGGSAAEDVASIAVGTGGVAFIAGATKSSNFPTTTGAAGEADPSAGSDFDAFVAKLNVDGSDLDWASYVGGNGDDTVGQVALTGGGEAWVVGTTKSAAFPTTAGAADTSRDGTSDGFLVRMSADGSAFAYGGLFGGEAADSGTGVALDSDGNPVVSGATDSTDLPGTAGGAQPELAGPFGEPPFDFYVDDAFVTRFGGGGATIASATYLGGKNDDRGQGIALDGDDNVYLTGLAVSDDFPATAGAFQTTDQGPGDGGEGFVAKLSPDLSTATYATYLGGSVLDAPAAIRVDGSGNAHVVGTTFSPTFPVTGDAYQPDPGPDDGSLFGNQDGFYSVVNAAGSDLEYSTFLGGTGPDAANGLALTGGDGVVLVGGTVTDDFPATADDSFQPERGGQADGWMLADPGERRSTSVSVECAPESVLLGGTSTCEATVEDTGPPPATEPTGTVTFEADGPGSFDGDCTLAGGSCSVVFTAEEPGAPEIEITATYGGDATHSGSSGTTTVEVTSGIIKGTVTGDGEPLQAATVTAIPVGGGDPVSDETGAAGKYSLTVAAGGYTISFERGENTAYLDEFYDDKPDPDSADTVTVEDGQTVDNIDADLALGGSITGTVTDADEQPLAGVTVELPGEDADPVETDADGKYEIEGLEAGSYEVRFAPDPDGDLLPELYDDVPDLEGAEGTAVAVTVGEETSGIDAQLDEGATISGTVTGQGDAALEGVAVLVRDPGTGDLLDPSAETNFDGEFTIEDLYAGDYVVEFDPGEESAYAGEFYDDKPSADDADAVTVEKAEEVTGIDARLEKSGTIEGTVTGPDGAALGDVTVTVADDDDFSEDVLTEPDGTYALGGLKPGDYTVRFDPTDLEGDLLTEFYDDHLEEDDADTVPVPEGTIVSGIDAQMEQGGSITGTVTDAGGVPLATVQYFLYLADENKRIRTGFTVTGGGYEINSLPAGDYRLRFFAENGTEEFYRDKTSLDDADPVAVANGQATTISVRLGAPDTPFPTPSPSPTPLPSATASPAPSASPSPSPSPGPNPAVKVKSKSAAVKKGAVTFSITCPTGCSVALYASVSGNRSATLAKRKLIGKARVKAKATATRVKLKLNKAGRRYVRRKTRKATLRIKPVGGKTKSFAVKLKP